MSEHEDATHTPDLGMSNYQHSGKPIYDHMGGAWYAEPHGPLNPKERHNADLDDDMPEGFSDDDQITLNGIGDSIAQRRRLTIQGARDLALLLWRAAQKAEDTRNRRYADEALKEQQERQAAEAEKVRGTPVASSEDPRLRDLRDGFTFRGKPLEFFTSPITTLKKNEDGTLSPVEGGWTDQGKVGERPIDKLLAKVEAKKTITAEDLYDGETYIPGTAPGPKPYRGQGLDPAWPGQTPEPSEAFSFFFGDPTETGTKYVRVAVARSFARRSSRVHRDLVLEMLRHLPDRELTGVVGHGDQAGGWSAKNQEPRSNGSWSVGSWYIPYGEKEAQKALDAARKQFEDKKPKERTPFTVEALTIDEAVAQAVGSASMAWSETPGGVFDSDRAHEIGEKLTTWIKERYVVSPPWRIPEKVSDRRRHAPSQDLRVGSWIGQVADVRNHPAGGAHVLLWLPRVAVDKLRLAGQPSPRLHLKVDKRDA